MSILKANHNLYLTRWPVFKVVSNIVNVHFESKPQQTKRWLTSIFLLCQISLMSILKANHNWLSSPKKLAMLCQISLMSILKANHNSPRASPTLPTVVSNIVNVHFESKPQLPYQVATRKTVVSNIVNVHFESKPQLRLNFLNYLRRLCQISLMSILKANHNV